LPLSVQEEDDTEYDADDRDDEEQEVHDSIPFRKESRQGAAFVPFPKRIFRNYLHDSEGSTQGPAGST
jgi:hypothetical protein